MKKFLVILSIATTHFLLRLLIVNLLVSRVMTGVSTTQSEGLSFDKGIYLLYKALSFPVAYFDFVPEQLFKGYLSIITMIINSIICALLIYYFYIGIRRLCVSKISV